MGSKNTSGVSAADTATQSAKMSRLRWRCRRGMRELDEAMLTYLEHHYPHATEQEREYFEQLQELQDPELYQLVMGKAREARYQTIIDKINSTMGHNNTPITHT